MLIKRNDYVYAVNASARKNKLKRFFFADSYFIHNLTTTFKSLPKRVDLRKTGFYSNVVDQGTMETSIGISLVNGCLEYISRKDIEMFEVLSPLYVYKKDRTAMFPDSRRTSTTLLDAIEILINLGCVPKKFDAYSSSNFNYFENGEAMSILGSPYIVRKVYKLNSIRDIRRCLADGYPVASLLKVYSSLFDVSVYRTGEILHPDKTEPLIGHHAVTIVGYDDLTNSFIIRNSWSKSWGDYGYGYLPYATAKNMIVESYSLRVK
jgi:Papain family cysteine protease